MLGSAMNDEMIQGKWRRFHILKVVYATALALFVALFLLTLLLLSVDLPFDKAWLLVPAFFGAFPALGVLFVLHLCVFCAACPVCGKQYHFRGWCFIPARFGCAHCGARPPTSNRRHDIRRYVPKP